MERSWRRLRRQADSSVTAPAFRGPLQGFNSSVKSVALCYEEGDYVVSWHSIAAYHSAAIAEMMGGGGGEPPCRYSWAYDPDFKTRL